MILIFDIWNRSVRVLFWLILILFLAAAPAFADEVAASEELEISEEQEVLEFCTISNDWIYTLTHTVTLTNNSKRLAYDITVEVPLQDNISPAYARKIGEQLEPYPYEIVIDEDGRRTAKYYIQGIRAGSSVTLKQKYVLSTGNVTYHVDTTTMQDYTEQEERLFAPYLQAEANAQSDNSDIRSFTRQAIGMETNPYAQAKKIFSAVNLLLNYSDSPNPQNAAAVLNRKSGNCEGYANLYLASLRAAGIPARLVSGYLYSPTGHSGAEYLEGQGFSLNNYRHVWVEFYLPDLGWVIADPTFTYTFDFNGIKQKFVDWSYFANVNNSRRYIFLNFGVEQKDISFTATGGSLEANFQSTLQTGRAYLPFNDLAGHWAADSATYCVEKGYFNGVSQSEFRPDAAMTRSMFVAVLGRIYQAYGGSLTPYHADLTQFTDVQPEQYYSEALGWALDEGLVQGYGNGIFGVNDPITREQMAKMITGFVRILENEGYLTELQEPASIYGFTDSYAISYWAADSVAFCVGNGILQGDSDNGFYPQRNATRAQVSAVIQRIDKAVQK